MALADPTVRAKRERLPERAEYFPSLVKMAVAAIRPIAADTMARTVLPVSIVSIDAPSTAPAVSGKVTATKTAATALIRASAGLAKNGSARAVVSSNIARPA